MWETYGLDNEDLLWAGTNFSGGIAGQQRAPCGVVSASAMCLGLRRRCSLTDKERAQQARADARQDASNLVKSFTERFGTILCLDLIGLDFSQPDAYRQFAESGIWKEKCDKYVQFVIDQLYQLDEK